MMNEPESEICEECKEAIPPADGGGVANRHHANSCWLYDPTAA